MDIFDIEDLINNDPPIIKVMKYVRYSSSITDDMDNLSKVTPLSIFAKGVNCSDDAYAKAFLDELSAHSKTYGLYFLHIDCAQISTMNHPYVWDYLRTITTRPFKSVICIENVEDIPMSGEHDQLVNLFVHIWENDFLMHRNEFMVVFLSRESQSDECPSLLKGIVEMDWLGNLVTVCKN